jgi:hypothetical protein
MSLGFDSQHVGKYFFGVAVKRGWRYLRFRHHKNIAPLFCKGKFSAQI